MHDELRSTENARMHQDQNRTTSGNADRTRLREIDKRTDSLTTIGHALIGDTDKPTTTISLLKARDREKEPQSSTEKECVSAEYNCGYAEVERELDYGSLCNYKNAKRAGEGSNPDACADMSFQDFYTSMYV